MSQSRIITLSQAKTPIFALVALGIIFGLGLFVVGFDQGQLFSFVIGEQAYADQLLHELTHDMRHAAGFPCH